MSTRTIRLTLLAVGIAESLLARAKTSYEAAVITKLNKLNSASAKVRHELGEIMNRRADAFDAAHTAYEEVVIRAKYARRSALDRAYQTAIDDKARATAKLAELNADIEQTRELLAVPAAA